MLATSTVLRPSSKPAWQTEELEDEWVEPSLYDQASHAPDSNKLPASPSLTPAGTCLIREEQPVTPILPKPLAKARKQGILKDFFSPLALETMFEPPSPRPARNDQPAGPSPLAQAHTIEDVPDQNQENTFDDGLGEGDMEEETHPIENVDVNEPDDTPPESDDVILASDIPNLASFDGRKPSAAYRFTFSVPRPNQPLETIPDNTPRTSPVAPAGAPPTDARLRLFQFQYDTFTRDHLSAMVDSIAARSSSSKANNSTRQASGPDGSNTELEGNAVFLRATKRLKLSPPQRISKISAGTRPRRDYIGESRSLMQKIKQARSPSIMTTNPSIKENMRPTNVEDLSTVEDRPRRLPLGDIRSAWSSDTPSNISGSTPDASNFSRQPSSSLQPSSAYASSSLLPVYPTSTTVPSIPSSVSSFTSSSHSKPSGFASALGYRRQAADLMAQIRKDMTTGKRLVSLELPKDTSVEEKSQSVSSITQHDQVPVAFPPNGNKDSSNPLRKTPKPSPRKLLRRLSAADEVDRELALSASSSDVSLQSVAPTPVLSPSSQPQPPQVPVIQVFHVSTPAYNPAFLAPQAPTDQGRVVSGGTTTSATTTDSALTRGTSATTVSAGSVGSFVKHPGPAQMTRITPCDVPCLPEKVGEMRFDRELMRWVKGDVEGGNVEGPLEESEDPFKSFDTLESGKGDDPESKAGAVLEQGEGAVVEGVQLGNVGDDTDDTFEFDAEGSAGVVEVMTGVDSRDSETETTDSEGGVAPPPDVPPSEGDERSEEDEADEGEPTARIQVPAYAASAVNATPVPAHRETRPPPRSALKNGGLLPQRSPMVPALQTPSNIFSAAHRRSVSFSDGKKDGQIRGLGRGDGGGTPSLVLPAGSTFVPSTRGKRIAAVLDDLVEPSFEEKSPSKGSTSSRPPTDSIQPLASRSLAQDVTGESRRVFARSQKGKDLSFVQGHQTLLTECSFGIARDKLVEVITDVHPYVPYWEKLGDIDLSERGLESVVRLKEFLPRLNGLKLDNNNLPWLTGLPRTVRTLSVTCNLLTSMTSFSHLIKLEILDISNNQIDSLQQLSGLRQLRELRADGNVINKLDGLAELEYLTKLSLKGNNLTEVALSDMRWPRMEQLDFSRNKLRRMTGLSSLRTVTVINLDHNRLERLEWEETMNKLWTLRVSDNRLLGLDVTRLAGLRTLYADNNRLNEVSGMDRLEKLENLSLRNQGGQGLRLATCDIRDIKRLYLSGNPLGTRFIEEPCYNLVYLEVAACRLLALPQDMARLVPNLRVLNLNYNFISDARVLGGLKRLRKLSLIGSRLTGTKSLVRMLRGLPEIEMVDFRMNPCTLGWYLPIMVGGVPGALEPSEDGGRSWQEMDEQFRRGLPDAAYVGRLAYRGLVMRGCPRVGMMDGVAVSSRERAKAERLLAGVLGVSDRGG